VAVAVLEEPIEPLRIVDLRPSELGFVQNRRGEQERGEVVDDRPDVAPERRLFLPSGVYRTGLLGVLREETVNTCAEVFPASIQRLVIPKQLALVLGAGDLELLDLHRKPTGSVPREYSNAGAPSISSVCAHTRASSRFG